MMIKIKLRADSLRECVAMVSGHLVGVMSHAVLPTQVAYVKRTPAVT